MSRSDYKTADTITVPLTDAHIDFDIIPCDTLYASPIEDGKLHINNEYYDCIIIPYAKNYPTQLISHLNAIAKMGFTVIYADRTPKTALNCISMDPAKLPEYLRGRGFYDISVENDSGYLRYYHTSKEGCELFMFSNESLTETTDATIILPENTPANYTRLNLIMDEVSVGTVESNRLHITLEPYCSAIYIFGETAENAAPEYKWTTAAQIDTEYAISTASYENLDEFKPYKTSKLINILARNELPGFGGKVRYTAEINIPEELVGKKLRLNLGHVCECAELKLNGTDCGIRICPPYAFDITDAVKPGANELEFTAATTLAMAPEMKEVDRLSPKLIIPPAGVLGPVTIEKGE